MVTCDICGRETSNPVIMEIDGAYLNLCERCASKYASAKNAKIISGVVGPVNPSAAPRIVSSKPTPRQSPPKKSGISVKQADRYAVAEDYADLIRGARENLGMDRTALARVLGIKDSVLRNIEEGKLVPDIALAKKMEKVLGIQLLISETEGGGVDSGGFDREITLGDVVELRKKEGSK
ncbi:multiprotein bridging factor aMBF1 [Thermocladium modestius]|nr:multiprotein bridging factor aMBF1 [Thermocladium modestius]